MDNQIKGFYRQYKRINKIEIKLYSFDIETIKAINKLIDTDYNLRKCKQRKSAYPKEHLIKVLYNNKADIKTFINELINNSLIEIKNIKNWIYENIDTY